MDHKTKKLRWDVAGVESICEAEWIEHNKVAHVPLVPYDTTYAASAVVRRGRWGHP